MKQLAATLLFKPAYIYSHRVPRYLKRLLLASIIVTLFASELLRVYFIMPYPGSQVSNSVYFAYWLSSAIVWIRILGLGLFSYIFIAALQHGSRRKKVTLSIVLAIYLLVFLLLNFRFEADHIFRMPDHKSFAMVSAKDDRSKLVIGLVVNNQPRAYPIQLIGYHHQVVDTVGNAPVMITYCTVCRTGRAFSPMVNGHQESFRLVGMDHFNAMFEDAGTKSWWQQATGVAITGPLAGHALDEIPSRQMTLDAWLRQYPNSLIMQPDEDYNDNYFKLEDYDKGRMASDLVRRDTLSWKPKSWVVGVSHNFLSKAYDWNELITKRFIQDSIEHLPILLAMENDSASFHVYNRRLNGTVLLFEPNDGEFFSDSNTHSRWNMDGTCVEGLLKGKQLASVQSYNEFWHSWRNFHHNAVAYGGH